jgi:cellulose synthase/poly-beta-1,6-N-acetylglucosamine synthase-like glycosyltransferase
MTAATLIFWSAAAAVLYAYVGYALLLRITVRIWPRPLATAPFAAADLPTVTMLIPVHNERATIAAKLENVRSLRYAPGSLQVLFIADGCDDGTAEFLRAESDERSSLVDLPGRGGKAAALNAGLERATGDIVVFTDASIMLHRDAIGHIVRPFAAAEVGCVSGEDRIAHGGGEALYGRYELAVRRLESQLHSIVGASGSFYAQRRSICEPFLPGLAPDFFSVLQTVRKGYRAVSEAEAVGTMHELSDPRAEFSRKVRTILRGITTLAHFRELLNPAHYGWFAFELFSHKLMRWLVPMFLGLMIAANLVLAANGSRLYLVLAALQLLFYGLAAVTFVGGRRMAGSLPGKISLYFTAANVATASAWIKFIRGTRQEIWSPTQR